LRFSQDILFIVDTRALYLLCIFIPAYVDRGVDRPSVIPSSSSRSSASFTRPAPRKRKKRTIKKAEVAKNWQSSTSASPQKALGGTALMRAAGSQSPEVISVPFVSPKDEDPGPCHRSAVTAVIDEADGRW